MALALLCKFQSLLFATRVLEAMLLIAFLVAVSGPVAATTPPAVLTLQRLGHDYAVNLFVDGHLERFIDEKPVLGPKPHVDPTLIRNLQARFKDLDNPRRGMRDSMCDSVKPDEVVRIEYRGRTISGLACPNSALTRALAHDAAEVLDSAFDLGSV